jgi:hypothetical protein
MKAPNGTVSQQQHPLGKRCGYWSPIIGLERLWLQTLLSRMRAYCLHSRKHFAGSLIMHFLVGPILFLGIIWFMIVSPGFRYFVFALVGLSVLIVFVLNSQSQRDQTRREQVQAQQQVEREKEPSIARERDKMARSLMKPEEISVSGATLTRSSGDDWNFSGTFYNHSKYQITEARFDVFIRQCDNNKKCVITGQSTTTTKAWGFSVPVGQARGFVTEAEFRNLPQVGGQIWDYKITGVKAIPNQETIPQ